jgi:AAA family ATP:ADP antiporter
MTPASERPSRLEKLLQIVTEVRGGEGPTALLLTLNVFLLLSAYYVIKPVREALILAQEGGANLKSYLGGAIAIALLFAVPAYARFARTLPRNRLVVGVTLFFVSHILGFFLASLVPGLRSDLGVVFFIWVGIFNMMVVAQFWAFANDIYTEEQGQRLFALLGLGASVGAAAGSQLTSALAELLGTYNLLLVAAGLLSVCALLSQIVHQRDVAEDAARPAPPPVNPAATTTPKKTSGAFQLVWEHRYLSLIAAFSLVFTAVNTNGEYILGRLVKAEAKAQVARTVDPAQVAAFLAQPEADAELSAWFEAKGAKEYPGQNLAEVRQEVAEAVLLDGLTRDRIGKTYADFFLWVNVLGVLLQTFLVSRIVKALGLSRAFLIFPVMALFSAGATALFPVFAVLRIGKTAENATDYSLNNTLRNMLWLPTTKEMKYQAKQAVDTFFVRMGDVSSAVLVYVGAELLGWTVRGFAISNLVAIMGWLVLAVAIGREHRRLHP